MNEICERCGEAGTYIQVMETSLCDRCFEKWLPRTRSLARQWWNNYVQHERWLKQHRQRKEQLLAEFLTAPDTPDEQEPTS